MYEIREGLALLIDEIEKNPGKRSVAKLCMNSLWGKFAQVLERRQTSIFSAPDEYWDLMQDDTQIILGVTPVECGMVVEHEKRPECLSSLPTGAMLIAVLITSHARIHLHRYMEKIGAEEIIYDDTDSVVYGVPKGQADPLEAETGPFLGQLTNELSGVMTEFYTSGPKSYAFKEKMPDGSERVTMKSKGFKVTGDSAIAFEEFKELVTKAVVDGDREQNVTWKSPKNTRNTRR